MTRRQVPTVSYVCFSLQRYAEKDGLSKCAAETHVTTPPPLDCCYSLMTCTHSHVPTTPALAAAIASWLGMPCRATAEVQKAMEPPPVRIMRFTAGRRMLKQE
jgi:hypothetical protein